MTSHFADDGLVFRQLCSANSFVNCLASLLLVYLVYYMVRVKKVAKFSDFLYLVTMMAVYQALYDASAMIFYICRDTIDNNIDGLSVCYGVTIFFAESTGLASSAASNVIILCVLYVAVRQRRLSSHALRVASVFIFILSFLSGFFNADYLYYSTLGRSSAKVPYATALQIYSGTRLILSIIALCTIALITLNLRLSKQQTEAFTTPSASSSSSPPPLAPDFSSSASPSSPSSSSSKDDASTPLLKAKQGALQTLVTRLVYYPIVFIIARLGASWYEFAYDSTINTYPKHGAKSTQVVSAIVYALLIPLAGLGSFVVFLALQPLAWKTLKELVADSYFARVCGYCQTRVCLCCSKPNDGNINNDGNGDGGQITVNSNVKRQRSSSSSSSSNNNKERPSTLHDVSFVSSITTTSSLSSASFSSSVYHHHNVKNALYTLKEVEEGKGEEEGENQPSHASSTIDEIPPPCSDNINNNNNNNHNNHNNNATNKASLFRDSALLVNDFNYGDFDDDELVSIIISTRVTIQMEMASNVSAVTERVSRLFELREDV